MTEWVHKFLIRTTPKQRGCCGASYARGWIHAAWLMSCLWLAVIWVVVSMTGRAESALEMTPAQRAVVDHGGIPPDATGLWRSISGGPWHKVLIGGNIVVDDGVVVVMTYDTEIRDDDIWEPAQKQFRFTAPIRFTVPTSGVWRTKSDGGWELVEAREAAQP